VQYLTNYKNNYKEQTKKCDKYINFDKSDNSDEYNKCVKNTYDDFIKSLQILDSIL
jgi:hypothetical protein